MEHVRRSSLITQVTDQLRAEIQAGRWAVGTRIPTEPELSELTGTGRNTVREAVQALVHAGILERRQGSGTYVIATSEVGTALSKYFADCHERDVLELRQALDTAAAALAARRRDDADIATLTRLLRERSLTAGEDNRQAIEADVQLHRAIVAASHNAVYLQFYDLLLPSIEADVHNRTTRTGDSFDAEHEGLVEAIIAGDAERATQQARCFFSGLLEST